jgi:hypothetical protein
MNILVGGPSPSRGEGTWPYLLQEYTGGNLVNLSQAGAGNDYIYSSVMEELAVRKYDLVVIMWSDFRRLDVKVSNINHFNTTQYTSEYQRKQNDWPSKVIYPVNDQDYVDPNWVFGCGYINTGNSESQTLANLFENYYKYTDYNSHYLRGLTRILGMQGFLKSMDIPYQFCFVRELRDLKTYPELYNLLDQSAMVNDITVHTYATQLNSWFDPTHPGAEAHKLYVKDIINNLKQRKLL